MWKAKKAGNDKVNLANDSSGKPSTITKVNNKISSNGFLTNMPDERNGFQRGKNGNNERL